MNRTGWYRRKKRARPERRFAAIALIQARRTAGLVLALLLGLAPLALAERTKLKPGWNIFSAQQDVDLGRRVAQDAEQQLPIMNDRKVNDYLNRLGKKLAEKTPGEKYPYQFKAVNDPNINAFALPGGFIYINRGVMEAADTEAQLAGVMAHEIGHVALRHGTNQASKSYAWQLPLAALGGIVGSDSLGSIAAQLGAGFAVNSVLLKYSRDAERQSDLIATQILYDIGYDPRAMSQFFEKIEAEGKGGRPPQWLSSHPSPENRVQIVKKEIENLGGLPQGYKSDSEEFREIKRYLSSAPLPKGGTQPSSGRESLERPSKASDRFQPFENDLFQFRHPENWAVHGQGRAITLAPQGGLAEDRGGNSLLAYGVIVSVVEPDRSAHSKETLEGATDQLIDRLRANNPQMRIQRDHQKVRIGGQPALSTLLLNESPLGSPEYDWLITVLRPEGLVYFVCVVPQQEYRDYSPIFEKILDSVRFHRR